MKKTPDPEVIQHCCHKQVQSFKPMAEDVAHYHRAKYKTDSSDHSFELFFNAVNRHIRMKREDSVQEALSRGLTGSTEKAVPATYDSAAAPAPGSGKKGERQQHRADERRIFQLEDSRAKTSENKHS